MFNVGSVGQFYGTIHQNSGILENEILHFWNWDKRAYPIMLVVFRNDFVRRMKLLLVYDSVCIIQMFRFYNFNCVVPIGLKIEV
jgi:hypothetical protein